MQHGEAWGNRLQRQEGERVPALRRAGSTSECTCLACKERQRIGHGHVEDAGERRFSGEGCGALTRGGLEFWVLSLEMEAMRGFDAEVEMGHVWN